MEAGSGLPLSGALLHVFVGDVMKEVRVGGDGRYALAAPAFSRLRTQAAQIQEADGEALVADLLLAARNASDAFNLQAAPLLVQLAALAAEVLVEVVGVRREDVDAELDARARSAFGHKESLVPVGQRGAVAGALSPFAMRMARAKGEK